MNPTPQKGKGSTLEIILTFVVLFFVTNYALQYFFPEQFGGKKADPILRLVADSSSVREGNDPLLSIINKTEADLLLPKRCPQPPVNIALVEMQQDGKEKLADRMANKTAAPCQELTKVAAGETAKVNLGPWKYDLLGQRGTYEASLDVPKDFKGAGSGTTLTTRFSVNEAGFFTKLFRTFVTKPLFNGLIFIASYVPGHNLGIAIILLTIVVRLILLVPNQHALEGQRKLQVLQPKLDELKKKYPNDAKRQQEETLKLWKEYKINPLQSCLPTLLQFPILIGLFNVIRDGSTIATSKHLLYSFYTSLPANFFTTSLFGLDLLKPEIIVLPISLAIMQFIQMKMMFAKTKKVEEKKQGVVEEKKSWVPKFDQQTIMLYVFPVMIGAFAFNFPAAVAIYWGASTLFGIGQQWFVLRKKA